MSKEDKKLFGDFLFWLQFAMAWVFTVPQVIRSFYSTKGMTITWSMFCALFVLVNLFLALGAYRDSRSRKAGQVVFVYANWLLLWSVMFVVASLKGVWTTTDSLLSIIIVIGVAILLLARKRESLFATITEPITRGIVSLIVKSVPQLYIGYCIVRDGNNSGLVGTTLLIGHVTVLIRIFEICLAARQDGWSRKNQGLFISEAGNESTWLVTTVIWLAYW
ncbi:MAG: hypothetical protein WCT25_03615 [Candidatus Paceibacterota bacterium]